MAVDNFFYFLVSERGDKSVSDVFLITEHCTRNDSTQFSSVMIVDHVDIGKSFIYWVRKGAKPEYYINTCLTNLKPD